MNRKSLAFAWVLIASVAMVAAVPVRACAQQVDSLRSRYLIPLPTTLPVVAASGRAAPGSSSSTPTAFGPSWGDAFIGFGYQAATRGLIKSGSAGRSDEDGAAVIGIGLGDARNALGIEISYTSYSTIRSGFGNVGAISTKLHRALPGSAGMALGFENAINVNGAGDHGLTIYGVASKVWKLSRQPTFSTVTTSVGVGSGRFRRLEDIRNGKRTAVNVFGSIGLQLLPPLSVIADWTGQSLTLGSSIVPLRAIPLIITPAVTDVAGDHVGDPRFILGVGLGIDTHLPSIFHGPSS
ncbi:MAG TPA: hypothetical protein VFI96_08345 [Longimicrobiaceae bacterium]|nr:hypothetical protein [Longimicrobiaceae bacterium]